MKSDRTTKTGVVGFFIAIFIAIKTFIQNAFSKTIARVNQYVSLGTSGYGLTRFNAPGIAWKQCKADYRIARMNDSGVTDIIFGFAVAAILIAILVVILATIDTAMPVLNESSPYYTVQGTVRTTTVSGLGLLVIVLIIIAAMGLISVLMMIRRKND